MRPYVVQWLDGWLGAGLGELLAPDYGLLLCVGFALGTWIALRLARARGEDSARYALVYAGVFVAAIVGARTLTILANVPDAITHGDARLLLNGGLTAYGGFLGGAAGAWWALRRTGAGGMTAFLRLGDLSTVGIGIGIALTRIGCFVAGCDFGTPTALPWAVRYPAASLAYEAHRARGWVGPFSTESLPVHPAPLYEAALGLFIASAAWLWLRARRHRELDGRILAFATVTYAVGRFGIEAIRGDVSRGVFLGGLSTSQVVSLALLATLAVVVGRRSSATART